jgi:hypothetical protein
VNRGVAEHGVELGVEVEEIPVADARIEADAACSFDLRGTRVDADYVSSERDEFRGQRTVAASEVEDSLAWLRREQFDHRRAEIGDEARVARVTVRVPGLFRVHLLNYS